MLMGHETAGGSIVHTAEAVRQEVRTGILFSPSITNYK